MYSKTMIIGRVGKNPEMRYTPQGKAVTSFSVATSNKYGDTEEVTWFRVVTWQKQAEVCHQYVKKGMLVAVEGRLIPDRATGSPKVFEKKDGSWGSSFELNAHEVKFLSRVEAEAFAQGEQGENDGSDLDDDEGFPY